MALASVRGRQNGPLAVLGQRKTGYELLKPSGVRTLLRIGFQGLLTLNAFERSTQLLCSGVDLVLGAFLVGEAA
jgi:hypothetical protein